MDAERYQHVSQLRNLDEATVENLALDFTVDEEAFGKRRNVPLIPNGEQNAVTWLHAFGDDTRAAHDYLSKIFGKTQTFHKFDEAVDKLGLLSLGSA